MNLRQLQVLRTLLATGSTIAAAKAMGLSQSGVSRLLQQLESDLKLTLFARDKGRLIPTPEALRISQNVDHILLGVDRLNHLAGDLREGVLGPEVVRFGLPHSMSESIAPALVAEFAREFPGVQVESFFETTSNMLQLLEHRVIDFAFLRHEGVTRPGIEMEVIAKGSSVCVLPRDHPLLALPQITPKDLKGVPLILIGRQRSGRATLEEIFGRAGIRQTIRIETHSNVSACAYVSQGLGVAILSSFFANLHRAMPIAQRPFEPALSEQFGIATPTGVARSIAADALVACLRRQIMQSQQV